jgi:hypothetical protein
MKAALLQFPPHRLLYVVWRSAADSELSFQSLLAQVQRGLKLSVLGIFAIAPGSAWAFGRKKIIDKAASGRPRELWNVWHYQNV